LVFDLGGLADFDGDDGTLAFDSAIMPWRKFRHVAREVAKAESRRALIRWSAIVI